MKEYRIRAEFTENLPPRTYRRRIYTDRREAEQDLEAAREYYSGAPYENHNPKVFIECREVTQWQSIR